MRTDKGSCRFRIMRRVTRDNVTKKVGMMGSQEEIRRVIKENVMKILDV